MHFDTSNMKRFQSKEIIKKGHDKYLQASKKIISLEIIMKNVI